MNLKRKKSRIHGYGIFALIDFQKGDLIYQIPLTKLFKKTAPRLARISEGVFVDDCILKWINHSCDPNCFLHTGSKPKITSLRNIKRGEEITLNYNKTEKHDKKIKCTCGSKRCQGLFFITK